MIGRAFQLDAERLLRHSDVVLALGVALIVGLMIVPLPTPLLDLLLALNITLSIVLLLVAIYLEEPLRFASFPTVLLLLTLFRLSLNVSSTRLILLQADAGEVIRSFGQFVVRGNYVVGAVVFLILTLIQFIVITKGAERVAEVAARFALDAMPGKQMAIDADLRAGAMDLEEGRRRRRALERESQLFGAMDGALKFVKGDAIAGIVIAGVNIVAGLIVGVAQRGMEIGPAAQTYTLLTIGDGLVSQIPALLCSVAAGLVVTRVASDEEGGNLGRDIVGQVLAHPKSLAIAAGLLVVLGAVPGLPLLPFWTLGGVLGGVALGLRRGARARAALVEPGRPALGASKARALPAPPPPLVLELGGALLPGAGELRAALLGQSVEAARARVADTLGAPLPTVEVRGSADLPPRGVRVRLFGQPVSASELPAALLGEEAERALSEQLVAALSAHAHELVGIQEAQLLLDALERTHPALVREVVPRLFSPQLFAEVLRRLLEEGIAVGDLRGIVEALADASQLDKDPISLTEQVRIALRRQLSHRYAPRGELEAWVLDPMIEDAVRGGVQRTAQGSYLALEPALQRDILAALRRTVPEDPGAAVLVTSVDLRRFVRRLVELARPRLPVLSYQELSPDLTLRTLGRIAP